VTDGRGTFQASLTGRRGTRFALQLAGDAAPDAIAIAARGDYGGRDIAMPRRAVLLKTGRRRLGAAEDPARLRAAAFMLRRGPLRRAASPRKAG
jgi:hypothetical protein